MTTVSATVPVNAASPASDPRDPARLRKAAEQLESVFVRQLFSAMRETVPQDGMMSGGAGEEMFTSMLDEHVADDAPKKWHSGVTDHIVEQFRGRVDAQHTQAPVQQPAQQQKPGVTLR